MSLIIQPNELKEKIAQQGDFLLLDVRSQKERDIANLGGEIIPLQEIAQRFEELDPERETIVYCHHGVWSAQAAAYLISRGFRNVRSLSGGIERWSVEVDPKIPRY